MTVVMHRTFQGAAYRQGRFSPAQRELAEETAVAISCNGSSHAVLMATPADLEDLVIGFSLSERLVCSMDEIEDIKRLDCERGIDMQARFVTDVAQKLAERRRSMVGPVGCGLCGIESLEMAMRDIAPVSAELCLSPNQVADAVHALAKQQVLNSKTRSVHAAGWYHPIRGLVAAREDVGRHNALDKLIGALAKRGEHIVSGAIVMTSRLSIELVQKAAVAGCGMIISISAPTAIAVELADKANITLATIVRDTEFELLTHPQRVAGGGEHVSPDKLIYMANQIASFFKSKPHEEAVAGIAHHINSFWEPRMRSQLFTILKSGNTDLNPLVVDAGSAICKPRA